MGVLKTGSEGKPGRRRIAAISSGRDWAQETGTLRPSTGPCKRFFARVASNMRALRQVVNRRSDLHFGTSGTHSWEGQLVQNWYTRTIRLEVLWNQNLAWCWRWGSNYNPFIIMRILLILGCRKCQKCPVSRPSLPAESACLCSLSQGRDSWRRLFYKRLFRFRSTVVMSIRVARGLTGGHATW